MIKFAGLGRLAAATILLSGIACYIRLPPRVLFSGGLLRTQELSSRRLFLFLCLRRLSGRLRRPVKLPLPAIFLQLRHSRILPQAPFGVRRPACAAGLDAACGVAHAKIRLRFPRAELLREGLPRIQAL